MKKKQILAFVLFALFALYLPAAAAEAATTIRNIHATYTGITIVADGVEVPMEPEPFTADDVTYVPVRPVAEALGREVTWDEETNTIYIGAVPGEESWMKLLPPYTVDGSLAYALDGDSESSSFTVAGQTYTEGVYLEHAETEKSASALWYTEGKYQSITFRVGHVDKSGNNDAVITVYLDGKKLGSMEMTWDTPPKMLRIPISKVENIRIEVACEAKDTAYAVYDISFA